MQREHYAYPLAPPPRPGGTMTGRGGGEVLDVVVDPDVVDVVEVPPVKPLSKFCKIAPSPPFICGELGEGAPLTT